MTMAEGVTGLEEKLVEVQRSPLEQRVADLEKVAERVAGLENVVEGLEELVRHLHAQVQAHEDGKAGAADTYTRAEVDGRLAARADVAETYTKAEVEGLLACKVGVADAYTKEEVDGRLWEIDVQMANKANIAETYTEKQIDAQLAAKANVADIYTKLEIDRLVAGKVGAVEIGDYRDSLQAELWTPLQWSQRMHHSAEEIRLPLPDEVPPTARKVLVLMTLRCVKELPAGWYGMAVWTYEGPRGTNRKRIWGWHSGQGALAFNTDMLEFAVGGDAGRTLHLHWKGDSQSGCQAMLQIFGFRS